MQIIHSAVQCGTPILMGNNTRIHNLISLPQIAHFELEDAIISSKTSRCSGSRKQKIGNDGEVRKHKTDSVIFSFISTLYQQQQVSTLRCSCSLKFFSAPEFKV